MSMNAEDLKRVTLEEFEAMEKDERFTYELIDGIVMMTPSPTYDHQSIGSNITINFGVMLKDTSCKVIYEYDVRFDGDSFRPDVMVFCKNREEMPPEIIVEILSPSTRRRDLMLKLVKYEAMGVKEYWIVDPKIKSVTVHDFINETSESYGLGETIHSQTRPEIIIAVDDIFA